MGLVKPVSLSRKLNHGMMTINPSECAGNYSATLNNMKLIHWSLMGGLLLLVQRGGDWAGLQPTQTSPYSTKCNSPPTQSMASVPITVLLYNSLLLCGFNVPLVV